MYWPRCVGLRITAAAKPSNGSAPAFLVPPPEEIRVRPKDIIDDAVFRPGQFPNGPGGRMTATEGPHGLRCRTGGFWLWRLFLRCWLGRPDGIDSRFHLLFQPAHGDQGAVFRQLVDPAALVGILGQVVQEMRTDRRPVDDVLHDGR